MTRIIEHRQDAAPGEEVFELRFFQLRDGDARGCVVPADLAVDPDMMAWSGRKTQQTRSSSTLSSRALIVTIAIGATDSRRSRWTMPRKL